MTVAGPGVNSNYVNFIVRINGHHLCYSIRVRGILSLPRTLKILTGATFLIVLRIFIDIVRFSHYTLLKVLEQMFRL